MSNDSTMKVMRKSGILLHPTSFPNKYGIGDLGPSSYIFIDFLDKSGQKLWQVLPLGPTGYGDSPYQAFSSFAGQPLIISPEKLIDEGLLFEDDFANMPEWDPLTIAYGPAINYKFSILRKAFSRFQTLEYGPLKAAFEKFCEKEASWLLDYALFMAIKDAHGGVIWTSWDREIAFPTQAVKQKWLDQLKDHVMFYEFIQFLFYSQWNALKDYAHTKGIQVVGDIPIFVAFDSADVWAHKDLFYLDEDGLPTIVAGVPPDYFSETGQLWGNPLYDWTIHKKTDYTWWIDRISHCLKLVDVLRIDHFRGFEAYWAVPY
ncbi:MAG: 4-alpha-glucanotransferase, partial [Vallitaleaceae bacterium]|nr:4-alpha-glucanotransferase [Vallitaleaceae bacterium]